VSANQADHSVATLCRVLELPRSSYYAWRSGRVSKRKAADRELVPLIKAVHLATRGIYGSPRIHQALAVAGRAVGRKRVARLMREHGLVGITRRRKQQTTQRDPAARPAPDLVDRAFKADAPNRLWVADITQVPTRAGSMYLAMILDVFSRKIVGWAMSDAMPAELVIAAFEMAVARRSPAGVVHHSDQGSQYTSLAFTRRCRAQGARVSMGSVGDCYENAMAESFFATLEAELLGAVALFPSKDAAIAAVFWYVEGFYNTTRLHSSLGYRSPVQFERQHEKSTTIHSYPQAVSLPPGPPSGSSQLSA